jgi:hypothetical protein
VETVHAMRFKTGIKISFIGTGVEALGMFLDIMHHLDIGIKTPEGLITPFHLTIFSGFLINFVGVLIVGSRFKTR